MPIFVPLVICIVLSIVYINQKYRSQRSGTNIFNGASHKHPTREDTNNMEKEIYVDVIGYEGFYEISNFGTIRKKTTKRVRKPKEKDGYIYYTLCKNKVNRFVSLHRILFFSFNRNADQSLIVNHIDHNKKNNTLSNLELVSIRENVTHGKLRKNKTSKHIGVYYSQRDKVWRAQISYQTKTKTLGTFKTENEAHEAYQRFIKENNITNKYAI